MAKTIGTLICEAAGRDCDGLFGDEEFVALASIPAPAIGKVIRVKLDDPTSFGSDSRPIVVVMDDNPDALVGFGEIREGEAGTFLVNRNGSRLSVWSDERVGAVVDVFDTKEAADAVTTEENRSTTEKIAGGILDELKDQQEKARQQANKVLIGVGVIVVVIVIAAAFVLPKVKLPKVNVS